MKHGRGIDRFCKKEIEDRFDTGVPVRIPNSKPANPNFFQTSKVSALLLF
jgi:hypothetical protein